MPAKLAPFSARLIAMPRLLSNHRPSVLLIMPETRAGPAAGEHGVGEIELPGRVDLADADGGERGRAGARDQAIARPEFPHSFGDEHDDPGAEQIEEGGRARHQRGRRAVRAMQLGEIDALAVEAEGPAEGRNQEADGDDAPALIAERAFVDGDVRGGVQDGSFVVLVVGTFRPATTPDFRTPKIGMQTARQITSLRCRSNCQQVA